MRARFSRETRRGGEVENAAGEGVGRGGKEVRRTREEEAMRERKAGMGVDMVGEKSEVEGEGGVQRDFDQFRLAEREFASVESEESEMRGPG
jgi:hypothetical protein